MRSILILAAAIGVLTTPLGAAYLPVIGPTPLRFQAAAPKIALLPLKEPSIDPMPTEPTLASAEPDSINPRAPAAGLTNAAAAFDQAINVSSPMSLPELHASEANSNPTAAGGSTPAEPLTPQMMMHFFKDDGQGTSRGVSLPMSFVPPVPFTPPSKATFVVPSAE